MTSTEPGVITKRSPRSFAETVTHLTDLIEEKGLKLFGVIDQRAEAKGAGLDLRDTTLVLFGSPAAGTPVMAASPLAALDLPLKILIWAGDGQVNVSYYAPDTLGSRHGLSPDLQARLAGIDPLTDALVTS